MISLYKAVILIMILHSFGFAQNYNLNLISNVNDHPNDGYTDCWGYTAPNGDEYALLGVNKGISIVDVSDTSNIAEVDFIPWIAFSWYDLKMYKNYMYVSTEGSLDILIVDLAGLPDSSSVVGTYSELSSTPHNIYIDTTQALLYIIEDFNYDPSVRIVSLADPENPVELSTINTSIGGRDVHDLYARDSVLYIAEGNDPSVGFYDMSDPLSPSLITRLNIPAAGYVHQLWVSEDNAYMVTTEETADKTVKIWDIRDLDNIEMISEYLGESGLAHNAYIHEDKIYIAHYESGLKILDLSDPVDVVEMGSYDTYPQADTPGFAGAWGVYPFANNGMIYVSDRQTGLYVLELNQKEGPQITARNVEFGNREIGIASDTLSLTIRNNGTQDLMITGISEIDPPFNLIGIPELPLGISPNRTFDLGVTFTPSNEDTAETMLIITSNDADNSMTEIVLSGQGITLNPAEPGVIYGSIGNFAESAGGLIKIDQSTGAGTLVGLTNIVGASFGAPGIPSVAINSAGELFISHIDANSSIYKLDALSGTPIHVASTGLFIIRALSFDHNDVLYAADYNGDLYTINLKTGSPTLVGKMGFGARGLAFDPTDGKLWASDNANKIYQVDLTSGKGILVGNTGLSNGTTDISFDEIGNLYGAIGKSVEANNLISINKLDGTGTVIGPIGFTSVAGMGTYHETYWMITIQDVELNKSVLIPEVDTLKISTKISNPNSYDLTVRAIVESYDSSISDTLELYDDGAHDDSLAGDGIWGGSSPVKSADGYFSVHIHAYPTSTGYLNNFLYKGALFTSSGPVVFDSYTIASEDTIPNAGDNLLFRINLRNESLSNSAVNLSVKTVSLDSCASIIAFSDPEYAVIAPGETAEPSRGIRVLFDDNCPEVGLLDFAVDIYSDGYLFWSDTFSVNLVTGLSDIKTIQPNQFALKQNYPNPFNPTTTIGYQIPQTSEVALSIYNLLGQEIVRLVSARQQAGSYAIEWDASGFASGIYYYILKTNTGFIESKKLILLK